MKNKQEQYRIWMEEVINTSGNIIYLEFINRNYYEMGLVNGLSDRDKRRIKKKLEYRIETIRNSGKVCIECEGGFTCK